MNRTEFIKAVSNKINAPESGLSFTMTQKNMREIMDVIDEVVYETINADETVQPITGVTLSRVFKDAHVSRNPLTGESIECPAKYAPKAKFGKAAKDTVNQ